jgi:nucleoid-associated protein YgaU
MNSRPDASTRAATDQAISAPQSRRSKRAATAVIATVGAATMVGATLAAPAAQAKANDPYRVWNRVAACESGQNWHISTGNGFYGGLQFSGGTWSGYHGGKYASRADRATRLEQIEVARRVLAAQGPGAWPVCGARAGLSRSSGHATHAALPRHAGAAAVAAHKKPRPKKHTTKHVVKHTAKHTRKHVVKHTTKHVAKRHHATYKVRPGDTLNKIAHRLHVAGGWRALFKANRKHLSNPNVLRAGQVLTLP